MVEAEFPMPDIGEGLAEVELIRWLVTVGDGVRENDPIAEVETDKAIVEMPAPATGRIIWLGVQEGQRIRVGTVWLKMEVEQAAPTAVASRPSAETKVSPERHETAAPSSGRTERVLASPAARKLASELGVPLEQVTGTGPAGRIMVEDVQRHAAQRDATAVQPAPAVGESGEERVPLRGVRRRIAEAMVLSSHTIPHVAGFHEFDAAVLVETRERLRSHAEAAGVHLTYLPFIVKATVLALREHPYLNALFDEEGQSILLKKVYNIGIAVATPEGLLVPVIHHADRLSVLELAQQIEQLTSAARQGKLTPADMRGGTFTITNVGPAGGWFGTSIIRHPEVAILGVGRIEERAVVRNGQIVARPILPISLTFDHRVLDGEGALAFVQTLRRHLENPELVFGEPPGPSAHPASDSAHG